MSTREEKLKDIEMRAGVIYELSKTEEGLNQLRQINKEMNDFYKQKNLKTVKFKGKVG